MMPHLDSEPSNATMKQDTRIVAEGRGERHGIVNEPVYRASTVLFRTLADLDAAEQQSPGQRRFTYGRAGTPTTWALEDAICAIEGGHACAAVSSGLAAVTTSLFAFLGTGDHLLMVDSVYGPTRRFCDVVLTRLGIETTYYDPLIGADIAAMIQANTKVVFLESPGSQTFEIQDVPAIADAARRRGVITIMDNTWATPILLRPLELGVDVSVLAATKYIVGHADALLGTVTTIKDAWPPVYQARHNIGASAAPDDCYLALRGLRTLAVRLPRHEESALRIAGWLSERAEVERVLHPALPDDPGHQLWKRDFKGASGLFGIVLKPCPRSGLEAFLNGIKLFGMGYSWGGFESLIVPTNPAKSRTNTEWTAAGPCLRIHIGLEDPDDLLAELECGFTRMAAAAG